MIKGLMNRRRLLQAAIASTPGISAFASAQQTQKSLDKYGGLQALQFEATGYFRVEKRDRWWLVTPEGHGYIGFGMNHIHPGWLNQAYNGEVWLKRFGAARYGDSAWQAGLRALVASDMANCGYNHFGVHNAHDQLGGLDFPEIRTLTFVNIPHYLVAAERDFPDVFSAEFATKCDTIAREQVILRREDPWLMGWAFTDCPIFTEAEAAARPVVTHGEPRAATPTWPRVLRNLPASSLGKQAWIKFIRARYSDNLNAFNDCYGVSFKTWDELLAAERWRELTDLANSRELADNHAFLESIVEQYYSVAVAAIRRYDAHHLIFGDKLNGNTDGGDAVVRIAAKHADLVFYQMYAHWPEQRVVLDRWSALTHKPFFNGDGTFSTPSEMMPNPHGPHARDQAERGQWAFEFGQHAFALPDFVGWTVCGWVDTWKTMPRKELKQHSGFFSPKGEVHESYVRRLRELSQQLYDIASSANR